MGIVGGMGRKVYVGILGDMGRSGLCGDSGGHKVGGCYVGRVLRDQG